MIRANSAWVTVANPPGVTEDVLPRGASTLLDVADAAAEHNCPDLAKDIFNRVIAVFVGSNYAAYRQRAEIGLADLRAPRGAQ
jgi:hypothetical protein